MPITTALIGCGGRGGSALGPWAAKSDRFELVAVCDMDEERATKAAAAMGVAAERDYRRVLERSDLQSVLIATGVRSHAAIALDAIAAGKHVFIEKPLADTPAAARRLAQAAEAQGVVGLVGYQNRFTPFSQALANELPRIEPVQGLLTLQRVPLNPQFFFPDHYGGIVDSATHTLDMALWTMGGRPEGVSAHVRRGTIQGDQTIEYLSLILDFDDRSRSASVVASMMGVRAANLVEFVGHRGTLWSTDQRTLNIARHPGVTAPGAHAPDGTEQQTLECAAGGDPTGVLLDHFSDLVSGGGERTPHPSACTFAQGAAAVAVSAAMVVAAEEGRRVALSEVTG